MQTFVARQAVFDRENRVVAYELLFRTAQGTNASVRSDGTATWHVAASAFLDIGMEYVVKGKRALLNTTRDVLLDDRLLALPPSIVGLEILETVEPDQEVLQACTRLKERGYLLALDDYTGDERSAPLLALADWVKVDFRALPRGRLEEVTRDLLGAGKRLLAEKVETEEERNLAAAARYELFQGYFLHRPNIVSGRSIPAGQLVKLQLLTAVSSPECTLEKVEGIVQRDLGLSYKLVRYANSPLFGGRRATTSLRQCLLRLGEREVRRWVAMALLPQIATGAAPELVESALIRARMCESIADWSGQTELQQKAFMTGMFSLLDAILKTPMSQIVEELELDGEIAAALSPEPSATSELASLLAAVKSYETEERAAHLPVEVVGRAYMDALHWIATSEPGPA
jgi:EAL and modified HD-GYP domain-containing signal transduction protein